MKDHWKELGQRRIPPGLHYVTDQQSDLWRAVAAAHSPAAEASVLSAYAEVFEKVARQLAEEPLHLVGLGAGSGAKELRLADALLGAGCDLLRFTAVDVSESLAGETAQRFERAGDWPCRALVVDFLELDSLRRKLEKTDEEVRRVFTAFGLSPNLRPGDFFPNLVRVLDRGRRRGDVALISANLWPEGGDAEPVVLAQYDNGETRRWLEQLFVEWGMDREGLPLLDFSIGEIDGVRAVKVTTEWPGGEWRSSTAVPPPPSEWRPGECVEMFFSMRYTMRGFSDLAKEAGLEVRMAARSECGREAVFAVARARI